MYTQIPGGWREGFGFIYGLILERNQKDGGEGTVLGLYIILNSNYFQTVQAAVFYKKNASKMFRSNLFMFLGLLVSCDKNKTKKCFEKILLKSVFRYLIKIIFEGYEFAKGYGQFIDFVL